MTPNDLLIPTIFGLLGVCVFLVATHKPKPATKNPPPKPEKPRAQDLFSIVARNECPDCHSHGFYEGPGGGMSTNIFCINRNCRSGFNFSPIGFCERIQKWDLDRYPPAE
jgi:hypothetical protein